MFSVGELWRPLRAYDIDVKIWEVVAVSERSALLFVEFRSRHWPRIFHSAERIRVWSKDYRYWKLIEEA